MVAHFKKCGAHEWINGGRRRQGRSRTQPAGAVKIGQSIKIKVTGSASGSRRFFMLYETP